MRKRVSRRRWKARALRGQTIPWSAIVEHRLERWGQWERRHDYQDAYLMNLLSHASLEGAIRRAVSSVDGALRQEPDDRRWFLIDVPWYMSYGS